MTTIVRHAARIGASIKNKLQNHSISLQSNFLYFGGNNRVHSSFCGEPVNGNWTLLLRLLACAVSMSGIFGAHLVMAQTQPNSVYPLIAPGEPQPWVKQTIPPHSIAYCSRATMTGAELMAVIQKIISHGDLTDIGFIEKSLNTKFSTSYGSKEDGTPDIKTIYFDSKNVLGATIHVNVTIWSEVMQKRRKEIADMTFQSISDENFITDCMRLKTSEFFSFFGGKFVTVGPIGLSSGKEAYRDHGYLGKNGNSLQVSLGFNSETNLIGQIEVIERP